MTLLTERLKLITKCSIWAILPESYAALLTQLTSRTAFVEGLDVLKHMALNAAKLTVKGAGSNRVAIIPIQGVLTKDDPWAGTTYKTISDAAEQAGSDPTVKHIILDVDSPGGNVTGLPETAAILSQVAKVKPVSAIVDGYAASAAYWLTSQANKITMAPSAEVGSVGVRMMHVDISKMLEDNGFKVTELYEGKFKTEWSPFKPLSDEAAADMQGQLVTAHNDFIKAIAEGRGVAPNKPSDEIANARYGEGRMFSAAQAMGHGLADAVQAPRDYYRAVMPVSQETTTDKGTPQFPLRGAKARLDVEKNRF